MSKTILLVPAFEPGRGGGHLCRCIRLTADLRAMGSEAWLYLPMQSDDIGRLFQSMNFNPEWRITNDDLQRICSNPVEFIVLDNFQTTQEELSRWKKIAPVIGIDDGALCRDGFDFLIDILIPQKINSLCGRSTANIANPALLKFPAKPQLKKRLADNKQKILVSFGQEDPAGLGVLTAQVLAAEKNGNMEITFLQGGLNKEKITVEKDCENNCSLIVVDSIPNLAEHLSLYDLVITHYGITAYEALYAGTPVLLINPTPYHEKLSKAAGFYTVSLKKLCTFVKNQNRIKSLQKHCEKLAVKFGLDNEGANFAKLVNSFSPKVNQFCPVCGGEAPSNSIARFPERTYRRCKNCGIIYMDRITPPPIEYGKEYFFEQYQKQYGKTYIEDFPNLTAMAKKRIKIISKIGSRERYSNYSDISKSCSDNSSLIPHSPTMLDIGCAYGPFLAAAREEGFSPCGIDPCDDAVRYVQNELGIPAVQGFFPPDQKEAVPSLFSVITLWFVIEHFRDCVPVLAEIKKLLKPGGVFAFSTPSFSGISGRSSLKKFLSNSPGDHWTVWSPKVCRKALALAGFKVKKIVSIGHHPQRFPLLGKFAKSKKSPLYWLFLAISRIFCLGDSIEVYTKLPKKHFRKIPT